MAALNALNALDAQAALADSDAARTAKRRYDALNDETRAKYDAGAAAGARLLARLEPVLRAPARDERFTLRVQADAQGAAGDVRDVVVENGRGWTLGVSVKHNN